MYHVTIIFSLEHCDIIYSRGNSMRCVNDFGIEISKDYRSQWKGSSQFCSKTVFNPKVGLIGDSPGDNPRIVTLFGVVRGSREAIV